jgi:anion transporter
LIGCLLFWALGVASRDTSFSGFVNNDTPWFLFGAILLGVAANKTGIPQRVGAFVVTRVGSSYSQLLLGVIITSFVLTPVVPSGSARIVIMAAMAIGIINAFGVGKGSNIGRAIFLVMTYTAAIFDKMIIAGAGAITARGFITSVGQVEVSWAMWFFAFLPCAIITIFAAWLFALWLFPPEVQNLEGRMDRLRSELRTSVPWTNQSLKASILIGAAIVPCSRTCSPRVACDHRHGARADRLSSFVNVLDADDMQRANLLPVFFVAAALSMSTVAQETGALKLLTDSFFGDLQPWLANKVIAVPALYWGGFIYHFATASEISMLATSLPVLMEFAKANHLNVLWIGMVWSFSAGGKLFAYQSAPLIIGYAYGYFKHTDLIKIGIALTIVEFVALALSVAFYWPLIGLG